MKMFMLTALLFCVAVTYTTGSAVCGDVFVWRNNNMTCPETNAVCADVFDTQRNWYNGTTCHEHRILHNCMCSGNQVCPVTDTSYKLFASARHTRYTCQSRCSLPWCADLHNVFAMTTFQSAPEFGGRTYNEIGCRCPRHHTPSQSRFRGRSVRTYAHRWDRQRRAFKMEYVCNGRQGNMADPCQA